MTLRMVRAVVEAQMAALRRHSAWMGGRADTIHVTGGASVNREILQVMGHVFGAVVVPLDTANAAALGAALRAWHADARAEGRTIDWDDIVSPFVRQPQDLFSPDRRAVASTTRWC